VCGWTGTIVERELAVDIIHLWTLYCLYIILTNPTLLEREHVRLSKELL